VVASCTGEIRPGARWRRPGPGRRRRCPSCRRRRAAQQSGSRCRVRWPRPGRPPVRHAFQHGANDFTASEPRVSPTMVPRAPKSHTGVPRPSSAGTNQTSPAVAHCAATVCDSAAVAMMPRSSRSHSMHVPADSMTASVPQVARPSTRKATIGNVPASPRPSAPGVPPVPRTGRACRRCRRWPWPCREACSLDRPGRLADLRRSRRWAGSPEVPSPLRDSGRVDDHRQHRSRNPKPLQQRLVPFDCRVDEGCDGRIGGIGHMEGVTARAAPPERVQAIQLSTVPKQNSPASARARSGSTSSRMAITLVADAFGAAGIPQLGGRGRSRPCASPANRCRGQRVFRWRAPTQCSMRAGWRSRSPPPGPGVQVQRGRSPKWHRPCAPRRIPPDREPANRQQWDAVLVLDAGIGSHNGSADTRRSDIDDENAPPAGAHVQGAGPKGEARPELSRVEYAVGIEGRLEASQHVEAGAQRLGQEA